MNFIKYRSNGWGIWMSLILSVPACQRTAVGVQASRPLFDSMPTAVTVQPLISEASGIADSKQNPGFLWVQEDSNNPPQLLLVARDGRVQKNIFIKGATNRDWEDMALLNGSIYIGDIGDNNKVHTESIFYKFPEPAALLDTVNSFETIRFVYEDGPRDAEAFVVDPVSAAIYLLTKSDNPGRIYKISPPFGTGVQVARRVGQLPYSGPVSATLSANASEAIIKTYTQLYYYKRTGTESIETWLQKTPVQIPYLMEPQGEAVGFAQDGTGYFTLSEKAFSNAVKLYFYKKR